MGGVITGSILKDLVNVKEYDEVKSKPKIVKEIIDLINDDNDLRFIKEIIDLTMCENRKKRKRKQTIKIIKTEKEKKKNVKPTKILNDKNLKIV